MATRHQNVCIRARNILLLSNLDSLSERCSLEDRAIGLRREALPNLAVMIQDLGIDLRKIGWGTC